MRNGVPDPPAAPSNLEQFTLPGDEESKIELFCRFIRTMIWIEETCIAEKSYEHIQSLLDTMREFPDQLEFPLPQDFDLVPLVQTNKPLHFFVNQFKFPTDITLFNRSESRSLLYLFPGENWQLFLDSSGAVFWCCHI